MRWLFTEANIKIRSNSTLDFAKTLAARCHVTAGRLAMILVVIMVLSFGPGARIAQAEGAFASGKNGAHSWWGLSVNRPTKDAAVAMAIKNCQEHGDCGIRFVFSNSCFAIAHQGASYVAVSRQTAGEAEAAALTQCNSQYGSCVVGRTACDSVSEAQERANRDAERTRQENDNTRLTASNQQLLGELQTSRNEINRLEAIVRRQQDALDTTDRAAVAAAPVVRQEVDLNNQNLMRENGQLKREVEKLKERSSNSVEVFPGVITKRDVVVKFVIVGISLLWGLLVTLAGNIPKPMRLALSFIPPLISFVIAYKTGISGDVTLLKIGAVGLPYGLGVIGLGVEYHAHA